MNATNSLPTQKLASATVSPQPDDYHRAVENWQRAQAWKYIEGYLADIHAARGGRNDNLNSRAFQVGRLAHYINDDQRLKDLLFEAAMTNGYEAKDGERATWATINSGFNAGMAKPRYPFTRTSDKPSAP